MNYINTIVLPVLISLTVTSSLAQTIGSESRLLAECEFIYSYTAQLMQLKNNSGAAISSLRRASIMTTANMMSSAEKGKISSLKIQIWTELRAPLKFKLDNKILDPIEESTRCDKDLMPVALNIRSQNLRLWGNDFDTLQKFLMDKLRSSTGI